MMHTLTDKRHRSNLWGLLRRSHILRSFCFNAMKDNLRHRLTEMHYTRKVSEDIYCIHFWNVATATRAIYQGVTWCQWSWNFDRRLKKKLRHRNVSASTLDYEWLLKNEAKSMKSSMSQSTGEAVGLDVLLTVSLLSWHTELPEMIKKCHAFVHIIG